MRYRGTIYLDVFADSKEEAEDKVAKAIKSLPNSFEGEISELPHGSKIS